MRTSLTWGALCALALIGCSEGSTGEQGPDTGPPADVGLADMEAAPPLPLCGTSPTRGPIAGVCLELWTAMRIRGEADCDSETFELGPRRPPPDAGVPMDAAVEPTGEPPPVDAGGQEFAPPSPDAGVGGRDASTPDADGAVDPLDAGLSGEDAAAAIDAATVPMDAVPPPDAASVPVDAARDVAPSPVDATPVPEDAAADAGIVRPPNSCLNADVRACACTATLRGEIIRVADGPPPVGCPLATIWAEAGGDVAHVQLALEGETLGILALRADSLGLEERLKGLGARATVEVRFARDTDGAAVVRIFSEDALLAVVQAGGALDGLSLSPTEQIELDRGLCSDQGEPCGQVAHSLLFQDGNAPYPVSVETVDELAGWRFAPYRLATMTGGQTCGPDQAHFGVMRTP